MDLEGEEETLDSSSVTKRTSEDLSTVLKNFEEISTFLSTSPGCQCLKRELLATEATPVDPMCYVLVDVNEKKCDVFKDSPENKPDLNFFWGSDFTP